MKIEDQLVSLELAKEQKELEVKQDSVWVWVKSPCRARDYECSLSWLSNPHTENYSAYTVAELGEMLPGEISEKIGNMTANPYFLDCGKIDSEHSYYVRYIRHATHDTFCIMRGSREVETRAKMLIYLIKEGIVKAEDIK